MRKEGCPTTSLKSCTIIIKKIEKSKINANHFTPSYKISEHEAILAVQQYLPYDLSVFYLYSHQEKIEERTNLAFLVIVNDLVDKVADKYTCSPINNHITYSPIEIYFDNLYSLTIINFIFVAYTSDRMQINT